MRLKNKVAFVTAAGQGIGRAIAEEFITQGAHVIATDLKPDLLKGLKADCHALNVLHSADVKALADKIGAIDILVNAAGFVHAGTILDCDDAAFDFSFDLNVKSMHRTCSSFIPKMLPKGGSIINIASICSSVKAFPNRYVYGASKAAVIGLTKAIAVDFIKKGIRCNAIGPGTVQSPSLDERISALAQSQNITLEQARAMFVDRQPMGRLGTAEEIAHLCVYLASDEASFTTGQIFMADGGGSL